MQPQRDDGTCPPCLLFAGVIPIAHNSGGPRADIVLPEDGPEGLQPTGFLAETVDEYAAAITKVSKTSCLAGSNQGQHLCLCWVANAGNNAACWVAVSIRLLGHLRKMGSLCALTQVLAMDQRDRLRIAAAAQRRAQLFSTERFLDLFTEAIQPLLPKARQHDKER